MVKSFVLCMFLSLRAFGMESGPIPKDFSDDIAFFPCKAELALGNNLTRDDALNWAQECYNKNVYLYYVPLLPVWGNFPQYYDGTSKYAPRLQKLAAQFYFAAANTQEGTLEDVLNGLYYLAWSYFPEKEHKYLTE